MLSLKEAKEFCRIDNDDEDALIKTLINTAYNLAILFLQFLYYFWFLYSFESLSFFYILLF